MRIAVLPFAVLSLAAGPLAGQTERGAFVVTLGKDTIVIEQYTRTRSTLEGDMLVRGPAVIQRHYTGTLKADGSMSRFEMTNRNITDPTAPLTRFVATFGDTTVVEMTRDTAHSRIQVATPGGALPFINFSYAMYEQYGRRALATGKDTVATLGMGGNQVTRLVTTHPARDSLTVAFENDPPTLFRVDAGGLIQDVDGRLSTQKVRSTRLTGVEFSALAGSLASRPLGQLSPPDSVRATVGGVAIAIDYGRPSMRGRRIFGAKGEPGQPIVQWNEVWRTGANWATRFTSSADLVVGGQTIPAGTYTLWTVPAPTGWKLIFSRQIKAPCATAAECADPKRRNLWGTEYSADSDFVRVDMQAAPLAAPLERFVITLEPQGDAGVLAFAWEKTRAWVNVAKK